MTDLTPTPNQLQSWIDEICYPHSQNVDVVLIEAWQAGHKAGADQELEACVALMPSDSMEKYLRTCRRPKPPTGKELALEALPND